MPPGSSAAVHPLVVLLGCGRSPVTVATAEVATARRQVDLPDPTLAPPVHHPAGR
jgi:hypothetical protein